MWDKINWKKVGLFLGGFAFGTVGLKALFSKDAKKCYTHVTAAALRVKDYTLKRTGSIGYLGKCNSRQMPHIVKQGISLLETHVFLQEFYSQSTA